MRSHPECGTVADNLFLKATEGNKAAYDFLCLFDEYFEDIEKFLAMEKKNQVDFVALLARTNVLYSLPYYIRNGHFLHLTVQLAISVLARGEGSADGLLFVVLAVATHELGFEDGYRINNSLRELVAACRLANPLQKS